MIYQERESLRKLAQCWNSLSLSGIENELTHDITYESQWVLKPIQGKKEFLSFLHSKFEAIKASMESEAMIITAELALHPSLQNRPCIVLTQFTNGDMWQALILISNEGKKINRIDICFIPDPSLAKLTGEFPL
ncbi:MAG: hypothetical protein NTV75_03820 [Bacteroidia bacterium]|nr:hypothetical protein [Bacteroidia bacterium]